MSTLEQLLGENLNTLNIQVNSVSRNILNSLYPKEFEAYFISLELVDENDSIEEYFTFPINPSSINKVEPRTKNIERTFGKIIVNKSDKFTPQDIVLRGNFGRDFKVLVRHKGEVTFNSILSASKMFTEQEFNSLIKSGYGSFKILQSICEKADTSGNGKPKKLFFHNYLLGESYLTEVIDFTSDQSIQQNMIWGYVLRLKIISPVNDNLVNKLTKSVSGTAQNTLNQSLGNVRKLVSNVLL